jgi:hypothetical protein
MNWKTIHLTLSPEQVERVKLQNTKVIRHLEEGLPLRRDILDGFKTELSVIVNQHPEFVDVLGRHTVPAITMAFRCFIRTMRSSTFPGLWLSTAFQINK